MSVKEMTGKTFCRITVISRAENNVRGDARWNCRCSCGTEKIIRGSDLRLGYIQSCGCLNKEILKKTHSTHGMSRSPTYRSWQMMKERCTNNKNTYYRNYGGRGITVCDRWLESFENFLEDMGIRPNDKCIERIDNDKGYFPENCTWATKYEQAQNRRNPVKLT